MANIEGAERIWIVGAPKLSESLARSLSRENLEICEAATPEEMLQATIEEKKIAFLAPEQIRLALIKNLGARVLASRPIISNGDARLLSLEAIGLARELRLSHDLEIAEAVAWKPSGSGDGVSLDLLGKAMLEIFSCRDEDSIVKVLLQNASVLGPIESVVLRVSPPFASHSELSMFHLAIPVQSGGDLLAHIYSRFQLPEGAQRDLLSDQVAELFLGVCDALALTIKRNRMLSRAEQGVLLWESSFNAVDDPVVVLDKNFLILRANKAYQELFTGVEIGKESTALPRAILEPYANFSSGEWELSLGERHYRVFMDGIIEPSTEWRFVIRMRDSTNEKNLRERLLAQNQMADLGILISSVAHEINNPVAGILLYAQILLKDVEPGGEAARDLNSIRVAAERLKSTVQTMLSLVRIADSEPAPVDIIACMEEVIALVGPEVKRLKAKLLFHRGKEDRWILLANRNHLLQALFHLIRESLLAIAEQQREDPAFKGEINIRWQASPSFRLEITDSSRSIAEVAESSVAFNVVKILIENLGGKLEHARLGQMNSRIVAFPSTLEAQLDLPSE